MKKRFFKNNLYYLIAFFIAILINVCFVVLINQETSAQPSNNTDAIAIRVIPNLEHYSAKRWYIEQGFGGSPQSLEVDGYEAVRDGRSVYVNAGNAVGTELFTNIYLISYNQAASSLTQDIFSQILNNWQFNSNLITPGNCSEATAKSCMIDGDCPVGEFCNSPKAQVIHDVRRMADLSDIETALKRYFDNNGGYPQLQGGTYIKGNTISTWPSWTKILARELAISIPVDPVNLMGVCTGFHPLTCWDEVNKVFDGTLPDGMPTGSRVYAYQARDSEYELCAQMETSYTNIGIYECFDDSAANNAPIITGGSFPPAILDEEYRGFVQASDPDGDALTWTYSTGGFGGWPSAPTMEPSSDPSQRRFYAATAGGGGGTVDVTVTDSQGLSASASYTVVIQSAVVPVISVIGNQSIIIGQSLDFTINATEASGQYPLTYEFSGAPHGLNANGFLDTDLHTLYVRGAIIDETRTYNVSVVARDSAGEASNPVTFAIAVNNNPPNIISSPVTSVEGCSPYNYQIIANEPDGHSMDFQVIGLPNGLSFDAESGLISGEPLVESGSGPYNIEITIRDEYAHLSTPISLGQAVQIYSLNITSESFSVTAPGNESVYVTPLVPPLGYVPTLYHTPLSPFSHYAGKTSTNDVTWSIFTAPVTPEDDAYVAIDVDGEIHAGAFKNDNFSSAGYNIDVQVTATTNFCNVSASDSYRISIYPNEWCGDSATQTGFGEECDDGRDGDQFDECLDNCRETYCGDGYLQTPNGKGINEECEDGNTVNGDTCDSDCVNEECGNNRVQSGEDCDDGMNGNVYDRCYDDCTATYCGDGYKQTPNGHGFSEECDLADYGTLDCFTEGFGGGILSCNSDCTLNTSNCTYCGDNTVQSPNGMGINEVCDNNDLNGQTCISRGYTSGGPLSCNSDCLSFNESNCCTPTSATVHPNGTVVADGIDNDCDGTIDEQGAFSYRSCSLGSSSYCSGSNTLLHSNLSQADCIALCNSTSYIGYGCCASLGCTGGCDNECRVFTGGVTGPNGVWNSGPCIDYYEYW